jgi:sugar phosphate isomerase/epimerase
MIYVSSACSSEKKIGDAIQDLVYNGFYNIELSGGTEYYEGYEEELLDLKKKHALNLIVHNYFPPHREDFVLNLASLNEEIYRKSLEHTVKSIELAIKLEAEVLGLHAGFFLDLEVKEVGKVVRGQWLSRKDLAIARFYNAYMQIKKVAKGIELYIENNVYSLSNFQIYGNNTPFMMCSYEDYARGRKNIDFKLLLDVGHLYVSCNTLNLEFSNELRHLISSSDYIHISDNNGLCDENKKLTKDGRIFKELQRYDLSKKVITLEIYEDMDGLKESYGIVVVNLTGKRDINSGYLEYKRSN